MKKPIFKIKLNDQGISLVEVIASIVLLSVLLLSFFQLLIQTSKSTATSEDIVNATYVAQMEMEELYAKTKTKTKTYNSLNFTDAIEGMGYTKINEASEVYFEDGTSYNFYIKLTATKSSDYTQLTRIVIKVYDKKNGILKAQVENTLDWGT